MRLALAGLCLALWQGSGVAQPGTNIWVPVGPMSTARVLHSATRLVSGDVVVAGGLVNLGDNGMTAAVEIFRPARNRWTGAAAMAVARSGHSATLLGDGRVLVAGGCTAGFHFFCDAATSAVEIYDPAANSWTPAAGMRVGRWGHRANLLPSGEVLITGGATNCASDFCDVTPDAEIFDPGANAWRPASPLPRKRFAHAAIELLDGRILVTGGCSLDIPDDCSFPQPGADIFDPATGSWAPTESLTPPRFGTPLALLQSGDVLLSGGLTDFLAFTDSLATYRVADGTWRSAGSMVTTRGVHSATALPDGRVLIAGGQSSISFGLAAAELYDPATGLSGPVAALGTGRSLHTATLLLDGRVLVAGGMSVITAVIAGAEVFLPGQSPLLRITPGALDFGSQKVDVPGRRGLTLSNASTQTLTILGVELSGPGAAEFAVTGSCGVIAAGDHCDLQVIFRPSAHGAFEAAIQIQSDAPTSRDLVPLRGRGFFDTPDFWSPVGAMREARSHHTATLLADGRVLVTGGQEANAERTAELYNPITRRWSLAARPWRPRPGGHTATRLGNGRVLVAGGSTAATELYLPLVNVWIPAGPMSGPRTGHSATLLRDGRVLAFGGGAGAEVYDPRTNAWTRTSPPLFSSTGATATLLPGGNVLVAGGVIQGAGSDRAQIYHPATDRWTAVRSMHESHSDHIAFLLPDGTVLLSGGSSNLTERYVPLARTWLVSRALAAVGFDNAAARLLDGRILSIGGIRVCDIDIGCLSTDVAELYDAATDRWLQTAPMAAARDNHTATLLRNGQILVAGGIANIGFGLALPLNSAEIYRPQPAAATQ